MKKNRKPSKLYLSKETVMGLGDPEPTPTPPPDNMNSLYISICIRCVDNTGV